MKLKQTIGVFLPLRITLVVSLMITFSFMASLLSSPQALAETISDRGATYCKKYKNDDPRTACTFGYVEGNNYCSDLNKSVSDNVRNACQDGAKKGANDRKSEDNNGTPANESPTSGSNDCGGVDTAIIKCDSTGTGLESNAVWKLLIIAINILSAGVGILAVGGIIYASILYTTAEDKQDQINKAKDIIQNVVIGLVAYALMWAGLNFLIPGGLFS